MERRTSCTPLTSTHSPLNPSRLHLLNILEIHRLLFCLHNKIQPRINLLGVVWCDFLHSTLKPLVIRNSSTRDSHYLQACGCTSFLSSVPAAGSPAVSDSTQMCRRRCLSPAWHQTLEGRRAGGCLHCEFHTVAAVDRSRPPFVCQEDLQRQRGLLCRADQMNRPLKPWCLWCHALSSCTCLTEISMSIIQIEQI